MPRSPDCSPPLLPPSAGYLAPKLPAPRQTFEEAFAPHRNTYYRVIHVKYPRHVREEIAQEGLLRLWQKWQQNPDLMNQKTAYVISAALFATRNWQRSQMRRYNLVACNLDRVLVRRVEGRRYQQRRPWTRRIDIKVDLERAVGQVLTILKGHPLEARTRMALLWWLSGKTCREIAQAYSLSLEAAYRDVRRGKHLLREALG